MKKGNEEKKIPRQLAGLHLASLFHDDYYEMLSHYELEQQIEITEHLKDLTELAWTFKDNIMADDYYKQLGAKEEALLRKYGILLRPYREKAFHKYFDFVMGIGLSPLYTTDEFNNLTAEEQQLTTTDIHNFLVGVRNVLYFEHNGLLIKREPAFTVKEPLNSKTDETPEEGTDKNLTWSRRLLLVYYFLKSFGLEHKDSNMGSAVARFIHAITGTRFTTIQNSAIYKKYRQMPNYNNGETLIGDLLFVRPYFEDLEMSTAVKEINDEIKRVIREDLPAAAKPKYRDLL